MAISLRLQESAKSSPGKRGKIKEKDAFLKESQSASSQVTPVGRGHRILVVDDNPVVLKAFEMKLKSDGFIVSTTENAARVASKIEQDKVELMILDIDFPSGGAMIWSGFTVIQWLQRFPELATVPVIFITGSDASQYRAKALDAGAVAFFEKPVVYAELLDAILKVLEPSTASSRKQEDKKEDKE